MNDETSGIKQYMTKNIIIKITLSIVFLLLCSSPLSVWFAHWEGEAKLAEAVGSKRMQIEDARAKLESAQLLAKAEIERAKGVAEANRIIGSSLRDNEGYLRWLYISNLEKSENNGNQIIYIPTEAGLPLLESTRLKGMPR